MARFVIENERATPIELVIEPWADVETLPSGAIAAFDYADIPPAEIQIAVRDSNEVFVYVNSEHVRMTLPDKQRSYGYGTRGPSFPILQSPNNGDAD